MPEWLGLFFIGMANAATVCTISCLSYLAPLLMSEESGFRGGVVSSAFYLSGKILLYGALGGLAGLSGTVFMKDPAYPGMPIMGAGLVIIGLTVLFRKPKIKCSHRKNKKLTKFTFFSTGIFTSLLPCPAVMGLLALAAATGSYMQGITYGLSYGMGLFVSPLLLACGGIAMMSEKIKLEIRNFTPYLNAISAVVILIPGVRLLFFI